MHAKRAFLVLLTILIATFARAGTMRERLVVDAAWLKAHLGDPDLVLLYVGEKEGYDAGHIPGARYLSSQDISVSDRSEKGLILEMPAADDLRQRLEALGISGHSRIVVYYGKDWVSPTTRVLFTLDYAGLGDRVSLLDGGMPAWLEAGGAVSTDVPSAGKGGLKELKINPTIVDAAFVREHLGKGGYAVVDSRTEVFYNGSSTGGSRESPHRTGHIRGAISIPFSSVVDHRNFLQPQEKLAEIFGKAGVRPDDTVITYCHIGQQATAVLFAARLLGHKVLLYDGSFQDWSRRADYPVENPNASHDSPH
jgi:thiosulfate/3-mercaptopyruvate sulfurtransferase